MPPTAKKAKGRKAHNQKTTKPPGPLSDCKLPHDVVLHILSRLPVKSLLRFRSVCKPWKSLIRNPKLISLHLSRHHSPAASPPLLLLHSFHKPTSANRVSILPLQPPLCPLSVNPFPNLEVVGTHNGVVCVSRPPWGRDISIFNPATKQIMPIHPPRKESNPAIQQLVSLGLGFDSEKDQYKVISINSVRLGLKLQSEVQVYNCDTGCWKKIEIKGPIISFKFTRCDLVLNGVPYWFANLEDNHGLRLVLVWFDVKNEVFHHISVPKGTGKSPACLVGWKGELAMIMNQEWKGELAMVPFVPHERDEGLGEYLDVWAMENEHWRQRCSVGPIFGMEVFLGCLSDGQIVGKDGAGNLIVYDPESCGIKNVGTNGNTERNFVVFNYRESLVSLKGEKPLAYYYSRSMNGLRQ